MMAANEPISGDMYGLKGADHICHRQAKFAGMEGTFRAFLTSRVQNLASLVPRDFDKSLPVVNLNVSIIIVFQLMSSC